ncbi:chemotaxis response regulator protein-glutamate methylesterase [Pseudoxanthobacter sp. M-2]|uniref:protein-glutamate methylesterase/protein-glutamine glutaminase n=1 Tax=Pseudoxanthobacter sp. M-2 TaxID=3078754 RepID=UPI0038FC5889
MQTLPLQSEASSGVAAPTAEKLRVMIVDDSMLIRSIVGGWLRAAPDLEVVATHANGRRAVDDVAKSRPDVVVLDLEMPEMDGLTALPLILERAPGTVVLVASSLTRRGAEISLRALTRGAADYLAKPEAVQGQSGAEPFRDELLAKIRALGRRSRPSSAARTSERKAAAAAPTVAARVKAPVKLRAYNPGPVSAIVVGSSTGGPQALNRLFTAIGPAIGHLPVLVTQHMPPTFTAILAEHVARAAGRPAAEGQHGETVRPGHIYVAPGGRHMSITQSGGVASIQLNDDPPVNFCRPAVDVLFDAASAVYRSGLLGIVLTGMGADGARGSTTITGAGGNVLAQDEATSVVWGMPGAVVAAGAAFEVLPISDIGPKVIRMLGGRK